MGFRNNHSLRDSLHIRIPACRHPRFRASRLASSSSTLWCIDRVPLSVSCRRWHKADRFLEFHEKLLIFESVCRRSVLIFKLTECYATETVVWRCYEAWLLQILLSFLCGFVSLDDVNLVDMLVVDAAIWLSENSGNDDWKIRSGD